ncbi:MAG: iron-sulfur cluster assembly scaffold protein [Deltaproteobacteria bacterium]|nr:iron-sulfur cluster assembly scaffold protein [Deltaproteobacteria bacterium]MBW2648337.1 iron-sulfur cluster assembly scaffold protein [Deltaproteobacteria bacterium]
MKTDRAIEEIMMGMVYEKAREIYSEALIEHGTNPRNYGAIDHPDGYAKITGPCGDTVEIFLRVANGKIEESKFNTDGCMFSIAACSAAAEMAEGKTMPACIGINQSAIVKHLEKMPADHEHCALLAAMTFQKALRQCIEGVKKD